MFTGGATSCHLRKHIENRKFLKVQNLVKKNKIHKNENQF